MLLTQEPTFFVFMVVTQEPTIRKFHPCIHGCHTKTNHNKISHVVTHVLDVFTHVFYMLLLLYFRSWKYSLLKGHHQSKSKFERQNFLRRSMHGCMRTCNKFNWGGGMLGLRKVVFSSTFSFIIHYIPSFYYPINIWVSPYYFPLYSF
jgi:hypothetical protein